MYITHKILEANTFVFDRWKESSETHDFFRVFH